MLNIVFWHVMMWRLVYVNLSVSGNLLLRYDSGALDSPETLVRYDMRVIISSTTGNLYGNMAF